jgi:hypothetical protein
VLHLQPVSTLPASQPTQRFPHNTHAHSRAHTYAQHALRFLPNVHTERVRVQHQRDESRTHGTWGGGVRSTISFSTSTHDTPFSTAWQCGRLCQFQGPQCLPGFAAAALKKKRRRMGGRGVWRKHCGSPVTLKRTQPRQSGSSTSPHSLSHAQQSSYVCVRSQASQFHAPLPKRWMTDVRN